MPSSVMSTGILPSGFCWRTVSVGLFVSAGSTLMSRSRPRMLAAILILRPNGDGGVGRKIIMANNRRSISAGDHEVDRLRSLALLVGLDIEADALPLAERFESGALD